MTPYTRSSEGTDSMKKGLFHRRIGNRDSTKRLNNLASVPLLFISILALLLYVVGTPIYFARLTTIYSNCTDECLTVAKVQALNALHISIPAYATYWVILNLLFPLVFCTVAAFILWRKSSDRVAWFASFSLVVFGTSFSSIPNTLIVTHSIWWLAASILNAPGLPSLIVFLLLFPDGRFVPRWTCWVAIGFAIVYMSGTFFPDTIIGHTHWPQFLRPLVPLTVLSLLIFAQFHRFRRFSTPVERQQTKWVVYGVTIALIGFAPAFLLPSFLSVEHIPLLTYVFLITSVYLLLMLIPLSIAFAILRYRLWDIDIIINRTLVYGALTLAVVVLYMLVVVSLSYVLQTSGNLFISLLATGLVAALFHPLRERLQRVINHLMYGERDEPYAVVTRLSQRLAVTLAPDAILSTIVETVAQALRLPYAAILLRREQTFVVVASYGTSCENQLVLPLMYQTATIGQLHLAPRTPGEAFSPADKRLLDELARQAGMAAHGVRLTNDLQYAREHLVTAREEERRRLRRDLHDGLGSALTSVMFKLDATDELLERDPARARALLTEVRTQTQESITDIRRLVYNLRPPILDEWGLIAALREHVAQYALQNIYVSLDAPESFPALPAAVEVAVYRITLEALANVIKHARATLCTIRLSSSDDALTVEVQDNGVGRSAEVQIGVGIHAMYERAAELGGSCIVEDAQPVGTRVYARFPLQRSDVE